MTQKEEPFERFSLPSLPTEKSNLNNVVAHGSEVLRQPFNQKPVSLKRIIAVAGFLGLAALGIIVVMIKRQSNASKRLKKQLH